MKKYLLILCIVGCKTKTEINNHKIYKMAVVFSNGDKDTISADIYGNPEASYLWNGNLHVAINSGSNWGVLAVDTRIASYVRSFKILK